MNKLIAVNYQECQLKEIAEQLAQRLQLPMATSSNVQNFHALLTLTIDRLELHLVHSNNLGAIFSEFLRGPANYRRHAGGGRRQLLARAVGLHKKKSLTIIDISAGLGKDAFILAALGAQVIMIERSPIIGALLADGWERAQQCEQIRQLSWQLVLADSREYLASLPSHLYPAVIYFDPMFPPRKKSALVKKDMRILRDIAGDDEDAPELLQVAFKTATERIVVKRPRLAEPIAGLKPSFSMIGQSSRFDIYQKP